MITVRQRSPTLWLGDPAKAGELASEAGKITEATNTITQHAKASCRIELKA